jgi:hypothetical protein
MSEAHSRSQHCKGQTGPKTAAGKRQSAGNARKHGLSAKRFAANSATERIDLLASALAIKLPSQSSAEDLIQQAAESHYDIEQIRRLKAEVLANGLFDRTNSAAGLSGGPLVTVSLDWQRLERYERRAFKVVEAEGTLAAITEQRHQTEAEQRHAAFDEMSKAEDKDEALAQELLKAKDRLRRQESLRER